MLLNCSLINMFDNLSSLLLLFVPLLSVILIFLTPLLVAARVLLIVTVDPSTPEISG